MLMNNNEYIEIIETIKGEIRGAQYKAALSVNRELIMLYYHIGTVINEHKTWGSKFIENLAADIRIAFPNVKGYSVRNLKYMAKLANTYPDEEFVQQAVAQIPWGHTVVLLDKFLDDTVRNWYINKTIENGWSRNVLIHQIESGLYERQALAEKISNFETRLASPQSELAVQTMLRDDAQVVRHNVADAAVGRAGDGALPNGVPQRKMVAQGKRALLLHGLRRRLAGQQGEQRPEAVLRMAIEKHSLPRLDRRE